MAKTRIQTEKKIILELTQEEAQYLWSLTQHYMVPAKTDEWNQESRERAKLREGIFMALAKDEIHG